MQRFFAVLTVAGCLGLVGLVSGCNNGSNAQKPAGPSVEEQVRQIQADPSIPPQAKAMAIRQLQARQGRSTR